MRLVEAVSRENLDFLPNLVKLLFWIAVFLSAFDELGVHGFHELDFFLADGAAEDVGRTKREACDGLRHLHDLLLIEHDAKCLGEKIFHDGDIVVAIFSACFAVDEILHELHGAWTIEGDQGDDVFDFFDSELTAELLHSTRFKLEDSDCIAFVEQLERFGIVNRYFGRFEFDAS